ncbi:MAG TPA: T9SS type A sorting domain-containing protein [Ignavibacteria bacterium]|nr:T9SS type A sorting domain-containing protein [Ignavibacteria bacterium]
MKHLILSLFIILSFSSSVLSQSGYLIIDTTSYGIRDFHSIRKSGTLLKDIYIQQGMIPGPQGLTGGNYYKLNAQRTGWDPVPFLNAVQCPGGNYYPVEHIVQSRTNSDVMIFNGMYVCGSDSSDYNKITRDGGATVQTLPFGGGNMGQQCRGFDIDATNSNIMYMAHTVFNGVYHPDPRIFKSTDAGVSWFVLDTLAGLKSIDGKWNTSGTYGGFLKVCPWNPNIIMAVTDNNLVYSTNAGVTFTVRNDVPSVKILVYDEGDQWIHGVSFDNKIWCNQGDPNGNWLPLGAGFDVKNIEVNPFDHNFWYGGSEQGVYKSTNWGLQWSLYNNSFSPSDRIIGIASDNFFGDTLVVASDQRVYRTWASVIVNIPINNTVPESFELKQNYPNPFNPVTRISYSLPVKSNISIKVYSVIGKELMTLVTGVFEPGNHSIDFNASDLSSGVYYYRLETSTFTETRKMVVVK